MIAVNSTEVRGRILEHLLHVKNLARIVQTANVQETIDACRQIHPNIIILDHKLLGGNVMDILEVLRLDSSSDLLIILTESKSQPVREQFLANGANYVLDHRIELDKIFEIIKLADS